MSIGPFTVAIAGGKPVTVVHGVNVTKRQPKFVGPPKPVNIIEFTISGQVDEPIPEFRPAKLQCSGEFTSKQQKRKHSWFAALADFFSL